MADIDKLPTFDISTEAWREYVYPNGATVRVEGAKTMLLEKRGGVGQDRHRLIVVTADGDVGMYIAPGWLAIRWQTADKKSGIVF